MKIVLIIAAVLALLGAVSEKEKGWWVVLFVAAVILYMAYGMIVPAA